MLRSAGSRSRGIAIATHRRLASSIAVISPRDGHAFEEIRDWSSSEVDAAVDEATRVSRSPWAAPASVNMRAAALRALAAGVRRDSERLAELETRDTGKPIAESRVDMATCGDLFEYYAEIAPEILSEETLVIPDDDFSARVVPSAAGVVAAVTPWNYPLMQAVLKVAPALASGCAVLLKPSPLASLTCLELGKLSEEAGLPSGALTIVTGGPPDGSRGGAAHLISHPNVDFLSFTGSTRGGMEMLGASAQHARRTGLELGG